MVRRGGAGWVPSRRRVGALVGLGMAVAVLNPAWGQSPDDEPRVRAVVEAVDEAVLTARLQETIIQVPKRPGLSFKAGDVLIEHDCQELRAQRDVARASVKTKALDLKNKRALNRLKAVGRHEVAVAQSEVNKALAEAKVIDVQLNYCTIKAPFDGQVSEIFANAHETPRRDGRLLAIVSEGRLELRIIVPSKWLSWISLGTGFEFVSDDTGARYQAQVASVAGKVDAVSQTITIVGTVDNRDERLLPGMGGEAVFRPQGS